ncbi:MAG: adenylate kinase, partial [Pseudomonadales bacterium]
PDDTETTVRNRLEVYHDQTKPLVDFYQSLASKQAGGTLSCNRIDGVGPLDEVQQRLESALA